MRKLISRITALTLALMLLMLTPAVAATCVLCGGETGSEDYLCTKCLLALLNQEPEIVPLSITDAVQQEDGTVLLTWADEANNGPYTVRYELLEAALVPFGWTAATGVAGCTFTLDRLVPGVSYVITVEDSLGQTDTVTYFAPTPGTDRDIGAKIRLKPVTRVDRSTKQRTAFSAAEIAEVNETAHGLYLRLTYSPLARNRHYAFQISVKAPNDFVDVIFSGTLDLHHGKSSIPVWGFIPMDDYFALLENYYGGIPTGEYTVTMYFNGNKVWSEPFTVNE